MLRPLLTPPHPPNTHTQPHTHTDTQIFREERKEGGRNLSGKTHTCGQHFGISFHICPPCMMSASPQMHTCIYSCSQGLWMPSHLSLHPPPPFFFYPFHRMYTVSRSGLETTKDSVPQYGLALLPPTFVPFFPSSSLHP